jgi:hypothetical protein
LEESNVQPVKCPVTVCGNYYKSREIKRDTYTV